MIEITDESSLLDRVREFGMAKRTAERLFRVYPGYTWLVNVGGGVVNILLGEAHSQWGVSINYIGSYSASDFDREIDMRCGELLERYHLSRGAADQAQISDARRDIAGRMILEA